MSKCNGNDDINKVVSNKERFRMEVVVAVDGKRGSQRALKWAVDRLLLSRQCHYYLFNLTLVHVRHSAPLISFNYNYYITSNNNEREADDQELKMLRSFRGFCARRQIKFEIVVVEDDDVSQALVDYAIRHRVENLFLGASSRNGLFRLFTQYGYGGNGIARTVLKWIPDYCNVFIISKMGKPNCVRNASSSQIPPLDHHHHPNHTRRRGGTVSELDTLTLNNNIISNSSFARSGLSTEEEDEEEESRFSTSEPCQDYCLLHNIGNTSTRNCKGPAALLLTRKLESIEEDIKSEQKQKITSPSLQTSLTLTSKIN